MADGLDSEQVVDLPLIPGGWWHEWGEGRVRPSPGGESCLDDFESAAAGEKGADDSRAVVVR
jgi:hypothetical protein